MIRLKRTMILVGLAVACGLGACSESKMPPDDDEGSIQSQKASSSCSFQFQACAREVLANSGLSEAEQEALIACQAIDSSIDRLVVAQAAIRSECL